MKKLENGFTLLELVVVTAIIGILAAIAIPQFAAYRAMGFDYRAKLELSRTIRTQDNLFAGTGRFAKLFLGTTDIDGEAIVVPYNGGEDNRWLGVARHKSGTKSYCYDSLTGIVLAENDESGEYQKCRTAFDTLRVGQQEARF